jgi:hypothetical protein
MPTPSSNAPDPQPPRTFPFSSCPDPEEQDPQSPASEDQSQTVTAPQSPSSWHPHPPAPYSADAGTQASMEDEAALSRSVTMSPGPHGTSGHDVDMEQEHEVGSTETTQIGTEDGQKQADADEHMAYASPEYARADAPVEGYMENSTIRAATGAGAGAPPRAKQKASHSPPPAMESLSDLVPHERQWLEDSGLVGMGREFPQVRMVPLPPISYLRAGSRFEGTQQSERQRYDVQVEIKHVDLRQSFLCGYLRIQGPLFPFFQPTILSL